MDLLVLGQLEREVLFITYSKYASDFVMIRFHGEEYFETWVWWLFGIIC